MHFERMVLMNLNGNGKKKRGREWINGYCHRFLSMYFQLNQEQECIIKNKNLDELYERGKICHFNTF